MPELPGRPNIGQLRCQARELLRAAADGEPSALARIRAFSDRVSLSAAQLAVAREHGFASWPALHAEVERRLAALPSGEEGAGRAETSWSFGGASPIATVAGTMYPGGLVAGAGHAFLDASLTPTGQTQEWLALPRPRSAAAPGQRGGGHPGPRRGGHRCCGAHRRSGSDARPARRGPPALPGARAGNAAPGVDPVPARERGWLELRGQRRISDSPGAVRPRVYAREPPVADAGQSRGMAAVAACAWAYRPPAQRSRTG